MTSEVTVVSIQIGMPRVVDAEVESDRPHKTWTTAIFKEPVEGPVVVRRTNLAGDGQADTRPRHGGLDKAVLAYSADHYSGWCEELGLSELPFGGFGENLSIVGQTEGTVSIGDTWQVGDVRLQVSQPRQPCWKLARRWNMPDLPKRVLATGRSGWYLRVLSEGLIEAGWTMRLIARPHPTWTVARANRVMHARDSARSDRAELASLDALSRSWKDELTDRISS